MGKDQIRFDIDSELKLLFQLKCLETGEKMTPVLQHLIEQWVREEVRYDAVRKFLQLLSEGQRPSNSLIVEVASHLKLSTDKLLDLCDRSLSGQ